MITYNSGSRMPDIIDTDQLCAILNVSKNYALSMLRRGEIKGFRINKSKIWKISNVALKQYIETH